MARKQVAVAKERAKSTTSAKMQNKSRSKTRKRSRNGSPKQVEEGDEPEVQIAPDSVPSGEEDADGVAAEEVNKNDTDVTDEEEEDEEEVENVVEGESNNANKNKNKNTKENGNVMETTSLSRFPMHRVSRIIKSEDPNVRISQEAVFLINKASEKFLQLFSMEAYACAFLERKKTVAYKHLSAVVTKRRRFDFLSDFVPERLKAEDALKEMPSVETS